MTASSEIRRVVLPEVVGISLSNARQVLENAGLSRMKVHYVEAYADEQEVVEQRPPGGRLVDRGESVELHVSRRNLIQYLPQVYHDVSEGGTSMLKGFLTIVQQVFDGVTNRLDRLHETFDPRYSDPDFLPWLASWLAITLSPEWDELHRRRMLGAASRLFPFRGTAKAIREFVRIYTGANVTVEENQWPHAGFRVGVRSRVGMDTVMMPPMNLAHCFIVRLDLAEDEVSDEEVMKIHQIIQAQKPAHTVYYLAFRESDGRAEERAFMTVGSDRIGETEAIEEAPPALSEQDSAEVSGPAEAHEPKTPPRKKAARAKASKSKSTARRSSAKKKKTKK